MYSPHYYVWNCMLAELVLLVLRIWSHGNRETHQDNNMPCRKQRESYWTTEPRVLVPYGLILTANSLGGTDSRNHDNTSMFPVNMYCVFSSVARAASVVYCLKMVLKTLLH